MTKTISYEEAEKLFKYKVELHVHLDGSVRAETIFDLAKKKKHNLNADTVEDLKKSCTVDKPCSLQELLNCFNLFMPVIAGDRDAVSRIAYEFCEDCAKQNIRYVEVRYCPHLLSNNTEKPEFAPEPGNFTPRDVVATIQEALAKGARDFNIRVNSILCCMTHRGEWCAEIVQLCKEFRSQGVVAIDSAGEDFIPGKDPQECQLKQAFKEAYKAGVHRTVHAGENGPVEGIRDAVVDMHAERIGHGYHVMDDPKLCEQCKVKDIHFEICPISSIMTKACSEDVTKHPISRFAKDGMNFSINTDDPIVLNNNLTEDYSLASKMGLSKEQIIQSIFNAARSSFASESDKKEIIGDLVREYGDQYIM